MSTINDSYQYDSFVQSRKRKRSKVASLRKVSQFGNKYYPILVLYMKVMIDNIGNQTLELFLKYKLLLT